MKRLLLGVWLGFAGIAWAQKSGVPPAGDVFNVNSPGGGAETPAAAVQNLYQLAAQMTADPSSGYDPKTERWPRADQAQKQWIASISIYKDLTNEQRKKLDDCASNLIAAIDTMEQGYKIHITQKNWAAQKSAQDSYARGRKLFALCTGCDTFANNNQRTPAPTEGNQTGKPGGNPQSSQPNGSGGQNGGNNPGGNPQSNQPGGSGGQNGGNNPGGPPHHGGVGQTGGNTPPNTQGSATNPGSGPTPHLFCGKEPEWVQKYKAEGADPPLRYQVGFNQGISGCLQDQCTIPNLIIAVYASFHPQARALLALSVAPAVIDLFLHPPGFSQDPDPYARGKIEASRLCDLILKLSMVGGARAPVVGPKGKISIPPGYSFYKMVDTIPKWLPLINKVKCDRNCVIATVNSLRAASGQVLEPAPKVSRGMLDTQVEREMGVKFDRMRLKPDQLNTFLNKMPEGTLAAISAENPNWSGNPPPPGPITNNDNVPGHLFWGAKAYGEFKYFDGQGGGQLVLGQLPANWTYRVMIVGNPLNP